MTICLHCLFSKFILESSTRFLYFYYGFCTFLNDLKGAFHILPVILLFIGYVHYKCLLISILIFTTHEKCLHVCPQASVPIISLMVWILWKHVYQDKSMKMSSMFFWKSFSLDSTWFFLYIEKRFYFHIGGQLQNIHFLV
jgi:hypothetical protein